MPKGRGAAAAFEADVAASFTERPGSSSGAPDRAQGSAIKRINITLPEDLLRLADREVFERKQAGKSASRSQLIAEALRAHLPEAK